jgi:hypothetical protein
MQPSGGSAAKDCDAERDSDPGKSGDKPASKVKRPGCRGQVGEDLPATNAG